MGAWLRALTVTLALTASVAWSARSEFPEEARHSLEMARNLVSAGDWSSAVEAYADHLRNLTTRDYRDKKTFEWILDAYQKQAGESPDFEPIKTLVKAKLPAGKAKADPISTWRLYHLLALVAQRQGNAKECESQLQRAIDAYPDVVYSLPEKESLLQHLYNDLALSKAQTDVEAAENFLVDHFVKDNRFDFVYLPPWKEFYDAAGTPERLGSLRTRIIEAYGQKIGSVPAKADSYRHYMRQLTAESSPQKPEAVIFGTGQ